MSTLMEKVRRVTNRRPDGGPVVSAVINGMPLVEEVVDVTSVGDPALRYMQESLIAAMRFDGVTVHSRQPAVIPEKPSTTMLRNMVTPEITGDTRQALAMEVEDKLGYTPLRKQSGAPSRLQRLLQELEIEAFDQSTVDDYKVKMKAHFQSQAEERDKERNRRLEEQYGPMSPFFRVETRVDWLLIDLSSYEKPIPEFVLNKCLQIKDRAPDAKFFVDELREKSRTLDPFLVVSLGGEMLSIEVWEEPEFEKTL